MNLKVKLLRAGAAPPTRATEGAAGYDLRACLDAPIVIPAHGNAPVPTGIAIQPDSADVAAFVFGRSGLGARHGILPANGVGVVDSDYRGEIVVWLANHSDKDYTVNPGERVAQLVLLPVLTPEISIAEALEDSVRGTGGFGSTGQ